MKNNGFYMLREQPDIRRGPAIRKTPVGSQPRVAIIHYWLVGMRGGEKVLESLCRMYPQADIFTHVYTPDTISELINGHTVKTTSVSRLPMAARMYQKYLPFMPRALEEIDLTGYDLVISSEVGPPRASSPPPKRRTCVTVIRPCAIFGISITPIAMARG